MASPVRGENRTYSHPCTTSGGGRELLSVLVSGRCEDLLGALNKCPWTFERLEILCWTFCGWKDFDKDLFLASYAEMNYLSGVTFWAV